MDEVLVSMSPSPSLHCLEEDSSPAPSKPPSSIPTLTYDEAIRLSVSAGVTSTSRSASPLSNAGRRGRDGYYYYYSSPSARAEYTEAAVAHRFGVFITRSAASTNHAAPYARDPFVTKTEHTLLQMQLDEPSAEPAPIAGWDSISSSTLSGGELSAPSPPHSPLSSSVTSSASAPSPRPPPLPSAASNAAASARDSSAALGSLTETRGYCSDREERASGASSDGGSECMGRGPVYADCCAGYEEVRSVLCEAGEVARRARSGSFDPDLAALLAESSDAKRRPTRAPASSSPPSAASPHLPAPADVPIVPPPRPMSIPARLPGTGSVSASTRSANRRTATAAQVYFNPSSKELLDTVAAAPAGNTVKVDGGKSVELQAATSSSTGATKHAATYTLRRQWSLGSGKGRSARSSTVRITAPRSTHFTCAFCGVVEDIVMRDKAKSAIHFCPFCGMKK